MNEVKLLQWTYSISILVVAIIQSFIPKFSGEGIYLGVRFSRENSNRNELKKIIKKYTILTIVLGLVLAIIMYYLVDKFQENYLVLTIFLLIATFILLIPILWGNKKFKYLKNKWKDIGPKRIVTISTEISGKKIGISDNFLWLYIIPFFIIVLGSAYILSNYSILPEMIPTHFDFYGKADSFSEKNIRTVLFPSIMNLIILLSIFASNIAHLLAKQKLSPENLESSLEKYLLARKIWTIYYFSTATLLIGFIQLSITRLMFENIRYANILTWVILGITSLIIVGSVFLGIKVGTAGEKLSGSDVYSYDADDDNWKLGGLIYYNKNDPATFVYKRVGVGVNINIATNKGKIIVLLLVLITILPLLLLL